MTHDDQPACPADPRVERDDTAAQAEMYRLMVENAVDVIIRYDSSLHRLYVSPSSREVLGYDPAEMVGKYASALIHPDDFESVDARFRQLGPAAPQFSLSFRVIHKSGQILWIEGQYRHLTADGGAMAVLRDITDRKRAETMLAEANEALEAANRILGTLAQQDGLTGLMNRRRFDEVLEEEFRRARRHQWPLSVLMMDADCFKAYNDRYGHLAGDECLRRISRTIEDVLRRPGDRVARYGGEEFVVLLPSTDERAARIMAERMRKAVAALGIEHLGSEYRMVTVSVGMASLIPFGDDHPTLLIGAADRALYRAKAAGRNRVTASAPPAAHDGGMDAPAVAEGLDPDVRVTRRRS
jgi:diguanylate cyclase (GGDEF)-like protein/PAS domain S-box-containing protein